MNMTSISTTMICMVLLFTIKKKTAYFIENHEQSKSNWSMHECWAQLQSQCHHLLPKHLNHHLQLRQRRLLQPHRLVLFSIFHFRFVFFLNKKFDFSDKSSFIITACETTTGIIWFVRFDKSSTKNDRWYMCRRVYRMLMQFELLRSNHCMPQLPKQLYLPLLDIWLICCRWFVYLNEIRLQQLPKQPNTKTQVLVFFEFNSLMQCLKFKKLTRCLRSQTRSIRCTSWTQVRHPS